MRATRAMIQVCERFFNGDWEAMKEHAKKYDPEHAKRYDPTHKNPILGWEFRKLVGKRSRSKFWRDVSERDAPTACSEVVNGDSVSGMKRAIELCMQGVSVG